MDDVRDRQGRLVEAVGRDRFRTHRLRLRRQQAVRPQKEFLPPRPFERPLVLEAPFVVALHENLDRRIFHNTRVDPLQPVIVPADHLVVEFMKGTLLHGRQGLELQPLGSLHAVEAIDRAVDGPAASPFNGKVSRYLDLPGLALGLPFLVKRPIAGVEQEVHDEGMRVGIMEHVEEIRIIPDIRVLEPLSNPLFEGFRR